MVETAWQHRYFIFVDWKELVSTNTDAKDWDPDTGGDRTFGSVRLSPSGEEPSTHSACNTKLMDDMKTKVTDAHAGNIATYNIYDAADGWTWETALKDMNLQVIEAPGVGLGK